MQLKFFGCLAQQYLHPVKLAIVLILQGVVAKQVLAAQLSTQSVDGVG
jgi:hypothetical protein